MVFCYYTIYVNLIFFLQNKHVNGTVVTVQPNCDVLLRNYSLSHSVNQSVAGPLYAYVCVCMTFLSWPCHKYPKILCEVAAYRHSSTHNTQICPVDEAPVCDWSDYGTLCCECRPEQWTEVVTLSVEEWLWMTGQRSVASTPQVLNSRWSRAFSSSVKYRRLDLQRSSGNLSLIGLLGDALRSSQHQSHSQLILHNS